MEGLPPPRWQRMYMRPLNGGCGGQSPPKIETFFLYLKQE